MSKIIFFEFAGREANMRVQRPYITALLDKYPNSELHLWDLTRQASDATYIQEWEFQDKRVRVYRDLHSGHPIQCLGPHRRGRVKCQCMRHKPPYEEPYRLYRDSRRGYDDDTVFVKLDDDVLWMDVERFDEVLTFLETHPDQVASANVTNNVVCAKYEPDLADLIGSELTLEDPRDPKGDAEWWALHTSADFALFSHAWLAARLKVGMPADREPVKTREGEAVSINFIAMKYPVLKIAADNMREGRLGDEGTIDAMLPWIIPNFRAAHLSFGPQEHSLTVDEIDVIRAQYTNLNQKEA